MELIFWWMPIAGLLALAAVVVAVLVARRRRADARPVDSLPIAHSDRLTGLPSYRAALARYRALLAAFLVTALVLVVTATGLGSRLASTSVTHPDLKDRDIVLCLDVSGSMIDYDQPLLKKFAELSKKFTGERVSLVLFNASAVTYFPLTSDYEYMDEQFGILEKQMASGNRDYYRGTLLGDGGSSLIGDGLASCTQKFDDPTEPRSRSIVLATDNLLAGKPIFTLAQAGELATKDDIRVYGINPGDTSSKTYLSSLADEYKTVVTSTGGAYYALDNPDAVSGIVDSITAEQATVLHGAPQLTHTDQPLLFFVIALLALAGLFVFAWRVRR